MRISFRRCRLLQKFSINIILYFPEFIKIRFYVDYFFYRDDCESEIGAVGTGEALIQT